MVFEVDEVARFWSKVNVTDDHWMWTGKPADGGYGTFRLRVPSRMVKAHRYAYALEHGEEYLFGSLFRTHEVDHTCRVRLCVRHLEWVTQIENIFDELTRPTGLRRARTDTPRPNGGDWIVSVGPSVSRALARLTSAGS